MPHREIDSQPSPPNSSVKLPLDSQESAAPERKTNRTKAVIFINFYALCIFGYVACTKQAVTTKGINTFDLCLIRALVLILGALVISRT